MFGCLFDLGVLFICVVVSFAFASSLVSRLIVVVDYYFCVFYVFV